MTSVDDRAWAGQATKTRKGRRAAAAASQTLGLRLDDIYLLSTTPKGISAVGGLSLLVDGGGITVVAPSAAPARTMAWNQTTSLSFRHVAEMPDGRRGTVLELVVGPRTVRFLVPTDRVAPDRAPAFEAHLIALASSVGVDLKPSAPRKPPAPPAAAPVPSPAPTPAPVAAAPPPPPAPPVVEAPPAPAPVAAAPPPPPAPPVVEAPPAPAPVAAAPPPPPVPPVVEAPPAPAPVAAAPPPPPAPPVVEAPPAPAPVAAAPPPPPAPPVVEAPPAPAPVAAAPPPPPAPPVVEAPPAPAPVAAAPPPPPAPVAAAPPPPPAPPVVEAPPAPAPVAAAPPASVLSAPPAPSPEPPKVVVESAPAPVVAASEAPVMGPYAPKTEVVKTDVTGPAPLPPPVPAYPMSGRAGNGRTTAALERARKINDAIAVTSGPSRRHRRMATTTVVVSLLAACIAGGAWYTVNRFAPPAVDNAANLRAIASGINIQLADVPVDWQLDTSATAGQSLPFPDNNVKQDLAPATDSLARCMKAPMSAVEQLADGGPPTGGVIENSAVFTGAGSTVSSAASIFPTNAAVDSELSVVSLPQFPACEQQFLMAVLKNSLPAGVTVAAGGAATALALPAVTGVRGTIVETPVELIRLGGSQTVFLESGLVASGRVTTSVYADSPGQPLNPTLFDDFVKIVAGRTQVVAGQVASPGQTPASIGGE